VPEPNVLFEMGGWQDETHDAWHVGFGLINEGLTPQPGLAKGAAALPRA
jgi:hypothetical protein